MTSLKNLEICVLIYALLGALLFLRPHQETFIGLDSSAIRLMTHAPTHGRDLIGVDQTLTRVLPELRTSFLYIPAPHLRMTRDRSFQLDDLDSCTYRPWFYPFLTYAALGFDHIIPGKAVDYFLPSLTLLFFILAGAFMASKTGLPGLVAALGLIAGLPLIPWFARGYYPEWAALLLVFPVVLNWLRDQSPPSSGRHASIFRTSGHPPSSASLCLSAFVLGLAACFHPVILPWSGAVFLLLIIGFPTIQNLRVLAAGGCFALGLTPLVIVTQWVTRPYGDIFNPRWMLGAAQGSTLFFLLLLIAATGLAAAGLLLTPRGRSRLHDLLFSPGWTAHALRLCAAMIPTGLLLLSEQTTAATAEGLADLWSVLTTPYGFIAAATILASFLPAVRPRPRVLLVATVALASVYLYLKGIEPFGLWSQRRLLPVLFPFIVASLAVWRDVLHAHGHQWRTNTLIPGGLAAIAAVMFTLHSPFYLLRAESGADAAIRMLDEATQDGLTFYDYHQYGSPLAALGQVGALPLSNRLTDEAREQVLLWAEKAAASEPVRWVSAFANPGLEQGVILVESLTIRQDLPRLRARRAFPAQVAQHPLSMTVLEARPIQNASPLLKLDKILDRGPLALRGPWGRPDIPLSAPNGDRLPARWTREGSAVIGPLPAPGEAVRIEMVAGAARRDDQAHQVVTITPPWPGPALELRVENTHTGVSGLLRRPRNADSPEDRTGQYVLTTHDPYDPAQYDIRGFDADLGVLLHRIRIEAVD
ncbi:hypothetical protein [Desulfonatronum lacustre]|uniref:hypothetical protein n=1 Tax=Desulfonatronum lacustre TaxID=66849 RepID=UPI00048EDC94|nr:hypothetical protein [Desulfonatronum lacustre]